MVDLWEEIIVRGLNSVILRGEHRELKSQLLTEYPEILETRLSKVETKIQMKVVEGMLVDNPAAFSEDFWHSYVDSALTKFTEQTNDFIYENGAWFVLLNRIKDMNKEGGVDWFKVLCSLSSASVERGHRAPGFETVLGWLVAADKKYLLKLLHRTETKKYPRAMKIRLYKELVTLGLLDVKVARRIRSDTSGELSSNVLAHLFENRSCYSDDDFQNLITQFSDTRHKWVARYIAVNMPIHLAPFLMGLKDKGAIKILEQRMNVDDEG